MKEDFMGQKYELDFLNENDIKLLIKESEK